MLHGGEISSDYPVRTWQLTVAVVELIQKVIGAVVTMTVRDNRDSVPHYPQRRISYPWSERDARW